MNLINGSSTVLNLATEGDSIIIEKGECVRMLDVQEQNTNGSCKVRLLLGQKQ